MTSKRVTSHDVARLAGVSRTTVSLVLNKVPGVQITDETRQRVMQAAQQLGYVPNAAAQALARRQSHVIGLILTRSPYFIATDAFLSQVLNGLIEVLHQHNMHLLIDIVEPDHQRSAYLNLVKAKHIDGIIFTNPRSDDEALRELESTTFPTVLMGHLPELDICSVDVDNAAAARMAVEHLLGLGHRRIACITNAQPVYTSAMNRLNGYRMALEAASLAFEPDLVRFGDFDPQSGYEQMKSLLDLRPMPTAVFVASDVVAIGAIAAIGERGLNIPGDIALMGFDDIPYARFLSPPLSTVHLPALDQAKKSCEILFQLIFHQQPPEKHVRFGTSLVIRQSCGASLKKMCNELQNS